MFPRVKAKGKYKYLVIEESYWENGKSKQRQIANFGNIEKLQKNFCLKKLLKAISKKADKNNKLYDIEDGEEKERIYWGITAVVKKLWILLDMDEFLQNSISKRKIKFNLYESILLMLSDRFSFPCSKLQTYLNQDKYDENNKVELHHFYRSLDILAEHKDDIEKHLYNVNMKRLNISVDVVFYDVTTLYFESVKADELKDFGYSKDQKFGEVQVVLGLIMNSDGMPIGYDVFPGNTYEGYTLKTAINKLRERYEIKKLIFVADQGMLSSQNINVIRESGYDYIIGGRIRQKPVQIKDDILDLSDYKDVKTLDERDILKIKGIKTKDSDIISEIKIILDRSDLQNADLSEIRGLCKNFINTLASKQIIFFLRDNMTDLMVLSNLIRKNSTEEKLLERIEKFKNEDIKKELKKSCPDVDGIKKSCNNIILNKIDDLKSILDNILKERIVVTWSLKRSEKNKKDRERLYEKAKEAIKKHKSISTGRGFRKYIDFSIKDSPKINIAKKIEEEQWDGFFGIQTNNIDFSENAITSYYHTLWKIENIFRIFKSHLDARPINHYTPKRIKGHLALCYIALVFERTLSIDLEKNDLSLSVDKIREAVKSLQASKIEIDGELFYMRSQISDNAKKILKTLKIKTPNTVTRKTEFNYDA